MWPSLPLGSECPGPTLASAAPPENFSADLQNTEATGMMGARAERSGLWPALGNADEEGTEKGPPT